jgi:hypothetical protein
MGGATGGGGRVQHLDIAIGAMDRQPSGDGRRRMEIGMATHEDAMLMTEVLKWSTAAGAMDAMVAVMSGEVDPETASPNDRHVFVLLLMGETIGTYTKQGLLDAGLVYDLWAPALIWARVGPAALRQREEYGIPELWENFEALANG